MLRLSLMWLVRNTNLYVNLDDIKKCLTILKINISYIKFYEMWVYLQFWSFSFIVESCLLTILFVYLHKGCSTINVRQEDTMTTIDSYVHIWLKWLALTKKKRLNTLIRSWRVVRNVYLHCTFWSKYLIVKMDKHLPYWNSYLIRSDYHIL